MANYLEFAQRHLDVSRQSGNELTVRCIFHDDHSPSMQFNIQSGLFICWSCQAKGSIKKILDHLGLESIKETPDIQHLKDQIQALSNDAPKITYLPDGSLRRFKNFPTDYRIKRGFTDEVVDMFELGYDPISDHAIIPVRAFNGRLIGITRRNLDPNVDWRYRDAKAFPKASTLFGAYQVSEIQTNRVCLVEGPLDACSIWSAGIPAVAQFGSRLTDDQVMILHKLGVSEVIVFMDNDTSGRKAATRAIEALKGQFLTYRVQYQQSDGKDPGELSRRSIHKRIDKAQWVK